MIDLKNQKPTSNVRDAGGFNYAERLIMFLDPTWRPNWFHEAEAKEDERVRKETDAIWRSLEYQDKDGFTRTKRVPPKVFQNFWNPLPKEKLTKYQTVLYGNGDDD